MKVNISFLLSLSILVPLVMGLVRIKRLGKLYFPFLIVLTLGFLAELASNVFSKVFNNNAPVIKVYSLLECCLVLYLFRLWRNQKNDRQLFIFLYSICIAGWVVENIVFLNIDTFSPYFRVFYAFIIVLLSINQINSMMFDHDRPLLKNPRFLLCLGFTILFLYQIIYEASYFIGQDKSIVANKIIIGFDYINFIINLLFAVAFYFITDQHEEGYNKYLREG